MDNMEERLGMASVMVDVLVAQKNRLAIMPANSRDWFYVENALGNSNAKWRNKAVIFIGIFIIDDKINCLPDMRKVLNVLQFLDV